MSPPFLVKDIPQRQKVTMTKMVLLFRFKKEVNSSILLALMALFCCWRNKGLKSSGMLEWNGTILRAEFQVFFQSQVLFQVFSQPLLFSLLPFAGPGLWPLWKLWWQWHQWLYYKESVCSGECPRVWKQLESILYMSWCSQHKRPVFYQPFSKVLVREAV